VILIPEKYQSFKFRTFVIGIDFDKSLVTKKFANFTKRKNGLITFTLKNKLQPFCFG